MKKAASHRHTRGGSYLASSLPHWGYKAGLAPTISETFHAMQRKGRALALRQCPMGSWIIRATSLWDSRVWVAGGRAACASVQGELVDNTSFYPAW